MKDPGFNRRIKAVTAFFVLLFLFLIYSDYKIQIKERLRYRELAKREHTYTLAVGTERGRILDKEKNPLAVNIKLPSVYAIPGKIEKPKEVARYLSRLLNIDYNILLKKFKKKAYFVWIKRKIDLNKKAILVRKNIKGIDFVEEYKRIYPHDTLGANLIGFVGIDNQGLYGAELEFDRYLKGKEGLIMGIRGPSGHPLPVEQRIIEKPLPGYDILLTIDEVIQGIVDEELAKTCKEKKAKGGMVIVMNPFTFEIMAISSFPTFNPNKYSNYPKESWQNRAISYVFEPGSIFKIATLSALLEAHKVSLHEKFNCKGFIEYNGHKFRDIHAHGITDLKGVVKYSCNVGFIKMGTRFSNEEFYSYLSKFGFGEKTGISLPGEERGMLRPPNKWSKISIASISIGQEVGVTAIQMISLLSAVANGGNLFRPLILKEIMDKERRVRKYVRPKLKRRIFSKITANRVKELLKSVTEKGGTGVLAAIPGFFVYGKTGTAQKAKRGGGGYEKGKYVSSFMGFVEDKNGKPLFSMIVVIDEPEGDYYGGLVAAPLFKRIAVRILKYMMVF